MDVRIGILGAARIAPAAVVKPGRAVEGAHVVSVAARDKEKAVLFARKHGIEKVEASYEDVLADPDVDAIYNPLPNGLHGKWTIAALEAGKHVLCEKPFTADAAEAEAVAAAAERTGLVCMEAFHYRYHPVAHRMRELIDNDELGDVRHVEASFCFPLTHPNDIRWDPALAGGALMDAGCYAVHMVRLLGGGEPEVVSAKAKLWRTGVDRAVVADLRFPSGITARIHTSMFSARVLQISAKAVGSRGELHVLNPLAPQMGHRLTVRTGHHGRVEHLTRRPTYDFQMEAFVAAVQHGAPILTGPDDSIATMRVIDAIYRAAGMEPRQPTP